jgi:hypothetical protein
MTAITDLSAASSVTGSSDQTVVNQSGTDKRATVDTLIGRAVGSWTPTITASSGTGTISSLGQYRKIGDVCWVWFQLSIDAKGTLSGGLFISGLPFTSNSGMSLANASVMIDKVTLPANTTQVTLQLSTSETRVRLIASGGTAVNSALDTSAVSAGTVIRGMFSYITA